MTADEFLVWAEQQPEGTHYELVAGEVVAMAPERAIHGRLKGRVYRALDQAIQAAGLDCEAFPDGMAVRVDANTVYEPDALVRCGSPLSDDVVEISDPIIVVEVVSPSSRKRDTGGKLEGYFRLPSVRHYLIFWADRPQVIHHRRLDVGQGIATTIMTEGEIALDPLGISISISDIYAG